MPSYYDNAQTGQVLAMGAGINATVIRGRDIEEAEENRETRDTQVVFYDPVTLRPFRLGRGT
jgi:hypothetical protein